MTTTVTTEYDVAIVGAGTAGCACARTAASAGLSVVLIEAKAACDVGRKVCGNALSEDGLAAMSQHAAPPSGAEIAGHIDGGTLFLPDGETTIPLPLPGVVLNRLVFGQRLLAEGLAAGAELFDECACVGWNDRGEGIIGVRFADGRSAAIRGRVVVDASGYRAVLTRDGGPSHRDPLGRSDVGIGYREIVPLSRSPEAVRQGLIFLGPEGARDGYAWIFPMGEGLANAGIGTTLPSADQGLKGLFRRFLDSRSEYEWSDPIDSGTGLLPLRRPLASLVGDGFMVAGDAGCQTNPLHGGGIAPSIIAGAMAGERAAKALAGGDTSAAALWSYNTSFMNALGARHAVHDVLRRVLCSLPDRDFSFLTVELARAGLLMKAVQTEGLLHSLRDALGIAGRAARRPRVLRLLARTARMIRAVEKLYGDYPESPGGLAQWIERALRERRTIETGG